MVKRKRWLPEFAGIGLLLLVALIVIFLGEQRNNFAVYFKDTSTRAAGKNEILAFYFYFPVLYIPVNMILITNQINLLHARCS